MRVPVAPAIMALAVPRSRQEIDSTTAAMPDTSPSTSVLLGPCAFIEIPTWQAGMLGRCFSIHKGVTFFIAAPPNMAGSNSPSSVTLALMASSMSTGEP